MHRVASFPSREQWEAGSVFPLMGNDGVERKFLQTKGEANGKKCVFEYVIDSSDVVTHQRFIEGGTISGMPKKRVKKVS